MLTDYHCHLLPCMDDGAHDIAESMAMLEMLCEQGIERVIATPHFYSHRESLESFLSRRQIAFELLQNEKLPIPVLMGAEIYLNRNLSSQEGLEALGMGNSKYLLLELPLLPFKPWMYEEISNIEYEFEVIPIIAHLDRYLDWYSTEEIQEICSISNIVIQINNDALLKRKSLKFVHQLVKNEYPVIFASDSHNLTSRAPNFDLVRHVLETTFERQFNPFSRSESLI